MENIAPIYKYALMLFLSGSVVVVFYLPCLVCLETSEKYKKLEAVEMDAEIYGFTLSDIDNNDFSFESLKGKVLLIVNTASKCGFTPQYEGLESLYKKYKDGGLELLGFPCDQFLHQEPGNEAEIKSFCSTEYGVSFLMFSKIHVNGADAAPLYTYLKNAAPGAMGSKAVKWNFTKFLVNRQGEVLKRYGSMDKPEAIARDIESLLDVAVS